MKPNFLGFVFAVIVLGTACIATADEKPFDTGFMTEEKIAQIQKLLSETSLDSKDFPKEMPLAEFLATVESRLPKGEKISLRLDEKALGKDFPRIAEAGVRLPTFEKVTVRTVLR